MDEFLYSVWKTCRNIRAIAHPARHRGETLARTFHGRPAIRPGRRRSSQDPTTRCRSAFALGSQHSARAVAVQGLRPARAEAAGPGMLMNGGKWPPILRPPAAGAGHQRPAPGQGPRQGPGPERYPAHRRRVVRRFVDGDAAGRGGRRAGDHRCRGDVLLLGRHVYERVRPADHLAHPRGCVRLHRAAADGLPRPAVRRRADQ